MNTPKVYAGSEKYLSNLAQSLLEGPLNNESSLIIWFPATGKSVYLQDLFGMNKQIEQFIPSDKDKQIFIYLQSTMVVSENKVLGFFRLLASKLNKEVDLKHSDNQFNSSEEYVLSEIEVICQNVARQGKSVTFVVDELEMFSRDEAQRIINGLSSLVLVNRNAIHTAIQLQNLDLVPLFQSSEKLLSLVQKIVYLPMPTVSESEVFIKTFMDRWKITLTEDHQKVLSLLSGNNMLVKAYVRSIRENTNYNLDAFLRSYEAKAKTKLFLNLIGSDERKVLEQVVFHQPISESLVHAKQYLETIKVLNKAGKKYDVYPKVLAQLIRLENNHNTLKLNNAGELIFGACNLTSVLSHHEYAILKLLLKHLGEVVGREQIAEVLWGEYYQKLYSDWAIDKTISRLRKQLAQIGFPESAIQTVKGSGFLLKNI
ncbi:MAG: helix-turn-helix domain-containing protein [Patescibacteria group bacterium]|jgi:hypothetical protein